jgi:UDP-N-acetylglucosamine 2-epimerase (non-hydrolysing)
MIDSLKLFSQHTINSTIFTKLNKILAKDGMTRNQYAILTLHRPAIVDHKDALQKVLNCLYELSKQIPILFPVHPRTKKQINKFGLKSKITWLNDDFNLLNRQCNNNFYGLPPLGYLDFMALMKKAKVIFTDSGGIQEESTVMGVPCVTLRENTERPITLKDGANILAGSDPDKIKRAFIHAISLKQTKRKIPEFWDGKTAERIVNILANRLPQHQLRN